MKRRRLLEVTGSALTAFGVSQLGIRSHGLKYARVLAQSTTRKQALLIGINDYRGDKGEWTELRGAVTDTMLQQELLIRRFGFQSSDVRLLQDDQATRKNIIAAVEELIRQSKPGDVVVIHFSGHGSTVIDRHHAFKDGLNGTLVPIDADFPEQGGPVSDITAGTLFLWMSALQTENVTVILDSCYSGGGVRGNVVFRSRPGQADLIARGGAGRFESNPEELDYQKKWLAKLGLSEAEWIARRQKGIAKGVTLLASGRTQKAADVAFAGDVYAGAFTYSLTRQLWEMTEQRTISTVMASATAKTEQFLKTVKAFPQTPRWESKPGSNYAEQSAYFASATRSASKAVVTAVQGDRVQVLLTTDPQSVEALGRGATFTIVDDSGKATGTIEIESRKQLMATGRVLNAKITPGTPLQETIRAIPKNTSLKIGLDASVRKEAGALNKIPRIEFVELLRQDVHYILGRTASGIGLFSPGLEPIPDSFGKADETVQSAIVRLEPKLRSLLAARILKLMLNADAALLKVSAAIETTGSELVGQAFTVRGGATPIKATRSKLVSQLKIGQDFRLVVQNQEVRDLYVAVVLVSPAGEVVVAFPQADNEEAALIKARQSITTIEYTITPPAGLAEALVIASTAPLKSALQTLRSLASEERSTVSVGDLFNGLDTTTRAGGKAIAGVSQIHVNELAALSMTFEVIAGNLR